MSILKKARKGRTVERNEDKPEPKHYPPKQQNPPTFPGYSTIPRGPYRTTFVPNNPKPENKRAKKEPLIPKDEKAFDVREDVRRGRPGRRSAIPGAKRSRKLTVNVSGLEYVAIVQAAEDQGVSTSTLLRLAVFDAYGVPRPHPEKVPTVAQKRREGRRKRKNLSSNYSTGKRNKSSK